MWAGWLKCSGPGKKMAPTIITVDPSALIEASLSTNESLLHRVCMKVVLKWPGGVRLGKPALFSRSDDIWVGVMELDSLVWEERTHNRCVCHDVFNERSTLSFAWHQTGHQQSEQGCEGIKRNLKNKSCFWKGRVGVGICFYSGQSKYLIPVRVTDVSSQRDDWIHTSQALC